MQLKKRIILTLGAVGFMAFIMIIVSLNKLYTDSFGRVNPKLRQNSAILPNLKLTFENSSTVPKETLPLVVNIIKQKLDDKLAQGFGHDLNEIGKHENNNLRSLIQRLKLDMRDQRKRISSKRSSFKSTWGIVEEWVSARELIPDPAPGLGTIIKSMEEAPIVKADVARKGTQLKLTLTLQDDQKVLFKPRRYNRDEVITGPPYAGADRHNGEIVSFHLSRLLNMRYAPLTVGRRLHVEAEIKRYASPSLAATFLTKGNHTTECFYGECYYCSEYDPVCPDEDGFLEGALVFLLPERYALRKLRHPYQRTYRKGLRASWETDLNYCDRFVRKKNSLGRVLDLIDVAIFDFLIGNADRHHYEVFKDVPNSCVLLIDNGKSFGNPYVDELTILAPLYDCCIVRKSTYERLMLFAGSSSLSQAIRELTAEDPLSPLLTQAHLRSLDRRMKTILEVISLCKDQYSDKVLIKN